MSAAASFRLPDGILTAAILTAHQLIGVLGMVFLFGLILYLLSRWTRTIYHASGRPWLDLYATGWIGTPVHELGHAAFCILFRHRITGIKLFTTNARDGSLGYVEHAYSRTNVYQQIGNFFIGAGPLISGTIVLNLLMAWLLPGHRYDASVIDEMRALDYSSVRFWIVFYVSLCVSSHMGLSPSDVKGMLGGMLAIALTLFAVNCLAMLLNADTNRIALGVSAYVSRCTGLFTWAVVISTINFLLSYLLLGTLHYRKHGRLLPIR